MKSIILFLLLTLGIMSCGNSEQQTNQVTDTHQSNNEKQLTDKSSETRKKSNTNKKTQVNYIFEEINTVETEEDRKKAIIKYLNYASQIDNNTAKTYANFAFDYLLNHPDDFLSVMVDADTNNIDKWATVASGKIFFDLKEKKDPAAYLEDVRNKHMTKAKQLTEQKRKRYMRYIDKLIRFGTPKK